MERNVPAPFRMPQNTKGCYEKIGYPRVLRFGEDEWVFKISGATRMIYECATRPTAIAKVMPAEASPHWKAGWDQNAKEAEALTKLRGIKFAPKVFEHFAHHFTNKWHQPDVMDVLFVSRLGSDLQTAANSSTLSAYCKAYRSALWATKIFAEADVVVTDPHPYNCSLHGDRGDLALPCDFGSATAASTAAVRKSLKALCLGFKRMVREVHGVDLDGAWTGLGARIAAVELPLREADVKDLNAFLLLAVGGRARPVATPAPSPVPEPAPEAAPAMQAPATPEPAPEAAPIAPESFVGRFVVLDRLEAVVWNGAVGFVRRVEHGRCVAKLWDNSIKSLRPANLTLINQPDFAWVCRGCANAYYKMCPEEGWTGRKGKWRCGECSPSLVQQPDRRSQILTHLGIRQDANPADIRAAYKHWVLSAHPDKGGDTQTFMLNNALWQELL